MKSLFMTPIAATVFLVGCNATNIKEESVSAELAPAAGPAYVIGYRRELLLDGKPSYHEVRV